MSYFFKTMPAQLMRFIPHQLLLLAFVFVGVVSFSTSTHAALNSVIPSTAYLTYTGAQAPVPASVDVFAILTTANTAALGITIAPTVAPGGTAPATINISNTGINALNAGTVLVTPPAGTTLTIPVDPYGVYTAAPDPNNPSNWIVNVPALAVGESYSFPATVTAPANAPAGTVNIGANYQANAVNIATVTAPVQIISSRTRATITFLKFDAINNIYVPVDPYTGSYHAGEMIYVQVVDLDQNTNPTGIEAVTVNLEDVASAASAPQDSISALVLRETGPNTGVFIGSVPSQLGTVGIANDNVMVVSVDSEITATYTDPLDIIFGQDAVVTTGTVLVDPFGIVFDSATGVPINGATITIIDNATGQPATVFGDDQVSSYPSTVVSGGSVTDSSGKVYNFAAGKYRFPFMALGSYHLRISAPAGYSYPTQVSNANIAAMAASTGTGPFTVVIGSRGESFNIQAGPPLHIDVPMDGTGSTLFVQKTVSTPTAAIGDRVAYQIRVDNVHPSNDSFSTIVVDKLPLGFRFQSGSAKLDGAPLINPLILNGRQLTFNIGSILPLTSANLTYTAVIGANANLGPSDNIAHAEGTIGGVVSGSNTSKATVLIREELIRSRGFIAGVVFVDVNMNEVHDKDEKTVPGIRIFMEDGRSVVTDKDGRYHFDGIKLGTHVVQMDKITIGNRYETIGLTQTRFSGNDYSQFVEVNAGGLARANFRVVDRAPEKMPVKVNHELNDKDGIIWADVTVSQGEKVILSKLTGFYTLPKGWEYISGSAMVDSKAQEPETTPAGLAWHLDATKAKQVIRLAMRSSGESGLKQAVAYARFSSAGTDKGRTGLAKLNIKDNRKEQKEESSFALNIKFENRKATLSNEELEKLNSVVEKLNGLVIQDLVIEGHTNNIPIAANHRDEFANNMVLSQARADYVANYFTNKLGLKGDVVHALGKGASEPIASNSTAYGRKANRRVILRVSANKITHDFSTALQDKLAATEGEAVGSWDEEKTIEEVSVEVKQEGILSPVANMSLPVRIASVRIALDPKLKPELSLDGNIVSEENIGFKAEDPETGKTIYTYIGVDFGKPGEHMLALKGMDPFGNARFEEAATIVRTGQIARIKLLETANNIADAKTPVRFRVEVLDNRGETISGSIDLQQKGGNLGGKLISETPSVAAEASQSIRVGHDGWVELAPVSRSGTHRIILGYNDVQETIELYIKPEIRDWILVGFGEGTVGYNKLAGAVQPITSASVEDKFYQDGRVAFYAKGKVSGDFLLTLAYDSAAKTASEKNSRYGDIDPNSMYTIYGDTTQQQFEASSSKKLYVKIEKDNFYALFGDYNTGLSTTELTRYSRTFTGVKAELHEDSIGFTAFATQTSQTLVRDDIRGNGTSGLYKLSRKNLITNTDRIRIETVDRFKSEVILSSIELTRHVDYDIDYVLGTIWFKQPILSKDIDLNPIFLRVEYESDDNADEFTTAGGRVYVKPTDGIEVGGTFVSEGTLNGSNTLSGVDAKIQVNQDIEVRAEAATSTSNNIAANAWKVEALMNKGDISGKAYARQQDDNFGLGQQLGSENSTLKLGVDGQYRLDENASLNGEIFRQKVINTGATRDLAGIQYSQRLDTYGLRGGVRVNRDTDGAGTSTGSTLLNIGATKRITNRLSVRADHEEALANDNSVDFPSRSSIGVDYSVTAATKLSLTQEWTRGQAQDTSSTRIGASTEPWNGARASVSYEDQLSENGSRSFANAGLLQTWKIDQALSLSASVDQSKVLSGSTPPQLNINAPSITGGEGFTAYSVGADYKPGSWIWTNRLEYRTSDLSKHHGVSLGVQGSLFEDLATQFTFRWQKDVLASNALTLASEASLRAAWRPSYDQLILLNRFDIRRNETSGGLATNTSSLRYINNLTANFQMYDAWQLRVNHGIKLTNETIGADTWSGLTDLAGVHIIYDLTNRWDISAQATGLRVRHLNNDQRSAGLALGYNMFDNFWLSFGYNFVGFYDQDFTASEYTREGMYMRFRFKFDQDSLEEMLK